MIRRILLLFLFALPALAQKNVYEAKTGGSVLTWTSPTTPTEPWSSEGNGGGDFNGTFLAQPIVDPSDVPQACLYGPIHVMDGWDILPGGYICIKGGHGNLHLANFGGGPFFIDDDGYIFQSFVRPLRPPQAIRDFANGVH